MPNANHHSHHHKHRSTKVESHSRSSRKKHGLFYKISFFTLLLCALVLSYFVVLVSSEPKSFPFVTQKIESELQEKFGNNVSLENSYITFTRYGTFKITAKSLQILYSPHGNNAEKQIFLIPKIEAEFSLLDLLLARFSPKKIKIINPTIAIDDLEKFRQKDGEIAKGKSDHIVLAASVIGFLQESETSIQNIEIEGAKILIRSNASDAEILLKKSQISLKKQRKNLQIIAKNQLNFSRDKSDVFFNSNCEFQKNGKVKCEMDLQNFVPNSVFGIYSSLKVLEKINGTFNAKASFKMEDDKISDIIFQISAAKGDLSFTDFFAKKIEFKNLSLAGEYDPELEIFDLSDISADLLSAVKTKDGSFTNPHLNMSLLISRLGNGESKKLDFSIKLQNVLNAELEKFWPIALAQNNIRSWVLSHIKSGMIRNSYAKFSLLQTGENTTLSNIDAEVIFNGFNLKYDDYFPEIRDISGVAHFDQHSMKISVASGLVLNSKIYDSLVAIDDFSAAAISLKILGKSRGQMADAFRHINYRAPGLVESKKYLNGDSQNEFEIIVPLSVDPTLKNTYIAFSSKVSNLDNPYAKGNLELKFKKDAGGTNFNSNVNLTALELSAKAFDITKKAGVESALDFVVSVANPAKPQIKNISLWKKEEVVEEKPLRKNKKNEAAQKVTKTILSKIKGNMQLTAEPFSFDLVELKNENFGKNNYDFSYKFDAKNSAQKIAINGRSFDLAPLIENKFFKTSTDEKIKNSSIQIAVNEAGLLHGKVAKNLYFSLSCTSGFCYSGLLQANYFKRQLLALRLAKKTKQKSEIEGRIFDVGFLAESLGLYNLLVGGDAKLKAETKMVGQKQIFDGEVKVDSDITIFESATVKRLAKNDLFSQIKDKIFSSEKTTFNSLRMKFDIQGSVLNIKSLLANNYKIGITAKGNADLRAGTYQISGMIVPGFIINNLFGIGKIPLIGGVISGILTGGEGGGLFGIKYNYTKKKGQAEGIFETNKVAAFVPSTLQNLFD